MKRALDGHVGSEGAVYVVTGARGAGKSTVCARVANEARSRGLTVAGLITRRSAPEPGASREVVDLRSGDSRPFGAQAPHESLQETTGRGPDEGRPEVASGAAAGPALAGALAGGSTPDPLTPGWEFASEVFAWANEALSQVTPSDLLVIDEVGPLELLGGRGWARSLELLRAREFRAALVVCRPGMLGELEANLGRSPAAVFTVDLDNRDALPAAIVRQVLG